MIPKQRFTLNFNECKNHESIFHKSIMKEEYATYETMNPSTTNHESIHHKYTMKEEYKLLPSLDATYETINSSTTNHESIYHKYIMKEEYKLLPSLDATYPIKLVYQPTLIFCHIANSCAPRWAILRLDSSNSFCLSSLNELPRFSWANLDSEGLETKEE